MRKESIIGYYDTPGKNELKLKRGFYRFECWGASGGSVELPSSRGAYVSGTISLKEERTFYLFVGEKGKQNGTEKTFNGGGRAAFSFSNRSELTTYGCSGGGATDIRLIDNNQNYLSSLKSRIIVAGAGGGEINYNYKGVSQPIKGGNGGFLIGDSASYSLCYNCSNKEYINATGGSQNKGGEGGGPLLIKGDNGSFGIGGDANEFYTNINWSSSGGGAGYFGGGAGGITSDCLGAGAGESSFISGYKGCSAVSSDFTLENPKFNGSIHYSGIYFTNIVFKNGGDSFLSPKWKQDWDSIDGAIIITKVLPFTQVNKRCINTLSFIYFIITVINT